MERKEVDPIEYFSPKEAAEKLKINPSTLRKYVGMINKEYGKGYFKRDDSNAHLYSPSDIDLLKRVIVLKTMPGITVENAVKMALNEVSLLDSATPKTPPVIENHNDHNTLTHDMRLLQEQKEIMEKQNADITGLIKLSHELMSREKQNANRYEKLMDEKEKLMDQNRQLNDTVQKLLEKIEEATEKDTPKKNWFSRLFSK